MNGRMDDATEKACVECGNASGNEDRHSGAETPSTPRRTALCDECERYIIETMDFREMAAI